MSNIKIIKNFCFYSFLLLAFMLTGCTKNRATAKNEYAEKTKFSTVNASISIDQKETAPVPESKPNTDKDEVSVADLKGSWAVNCENGLTELSIDKSDGFMTLYSDNAIYINVTVKKSPDSPDFLIYFKNTDSQKRFYKDKPNVNDAEISKDKPIGKLSSSQNNLKLEWFGLYNNKNQKFDFKDNFIMIKENAGKNPVTLYKCP